MNQCPCGSERKYDDCCGPIIAGETAAPTAEALMRSRYSAYVVGAIEYLKDSLAPESHGDHDEEAVREWSESAEWLGLSIDATSLGLESDETGVVDFTARYRQNGQTVEYRERSTFEKRDGKWLYVDGHALPPETYVRETPKVGRNEPCPCGSGKKFKKCCA